MKAGRIPIWLVVLMLAHIVLAGWFAMSTPYRTAGGILYQRGAQAKDIGAPDERQHANYVQRLLDGKGFGVLDPKDPNLYENYQAHQPPAYYILSAGFAKFTGVSDVSAPEGIRLRFLNALVGATGVAGVYFLALWAVRRQDAAIGAAVLASLLPMNLALSGAISNDPLLFSLCTWCLALLAKAISTEWSWKLALGVGVLAGIAMLTKTTALALLPAIGIAYFASRSNEKGFCPVRATIYSVLIAVLIAAPWFARNTFLYGDPLALSAFSQAFVGSPPAAAFINELGAYAYWTQWVGWWTLRSFMGVFGYMDIFLPNELYALALVGVFGAWIAGLLGVSKIESAESRKALWPCWTFLVVVILLFIRFNNQYFQGQARYILPAIGPLGALFGLGLARSEKASKIAIGIAALLMLAIDIYALLQLGPEFDKRVSAIVAVEL